MDTNSIVGLTKPCNDVDAVTKKYVDAVTKNYIDHKNLTEISEEGL